jgi:hypothetical protein
MSRADDLIVVRPEGREGVVDEHGSAPERAGPWMARPDTLPGRAR